MATSHKDFSGPQTRLSQELHAQRQLIYQQAFLTRCLCSDGARECMAHAPLSKSLCCRVLPAGARDHWADWWSLLVATSVWIRDKSPWGTDALHTHAHVTTCTHTFPCFILLFDRVKLVSLCSYGPCWLLQSLSDPGDISACTKLSVLCLYLFFQLRRDSSVLHLISNTSQSHIINTMLNMIPWLAYLYIRARFFFKRQKYSYNMHGNNSARS